MIGKVLQGRYQIVQNLDAGVFGQTYIAIDIDEIHHPKCVVKQLKVSNCEPSYLQTMRLHFLTETHTLKHLGQHDQIPELIACFEENERFYLVQEFVEGHALTAELPINQRLGYFWSEKEVVEFLQDVLRILQFVHSQGVIHCDVKPDNLIRRACDGKLVLIDFGSTQAIDLSIDTILSIYSVPATSLGYIPPEQFIGQTQPNSDIYALGMIAIQALTGLSPLQLKIDPHTNELIWRSQHTPVSDYLAAILSQMIRYNYADRFQSTAEVLRALNQMSMDNWRPQTVKTESPILPYPVPYPAKNGQQHESSNSSSLLTGMKVGLAANTLVMGFGIYSLMNNSPAYSGTETLYKATKEYQAGDLHEAIALAKRIPSTSEVYPEAQTSIEEWQSQWQIATEQYLIAQKALNEGRWSDVMYAVSRVPDNLYWQSKIDKIVEQAKAKIEAQSHNLLAKAYEKAEVQDFDTALTYLHQIPQGGSTGDLVREKMTEYKRKQETRAAYFLQQAYNQAGYGNFETAIKFLKQIPQNTAVYTSAQKKLIEYAQKQRRKTQEQNLHISKIPLTTKTQEAFVAFEPEIYLQEANIMSHTHL